jgi:hypothetical protein
MPNVFDQFDPAPSRNAFDQFDAPSAGIQPQPSLSGDMPVPAPPDAAAAYEQARDRWKATVERAKAQAQPTSGAMSPPTGMAPPMWGPFGSREGAPPPPSNALIDREHSLGKTLGRIGEYPGIALRQVTDAGETLGKVSRGEIDATSPEAIKAAADMAQVASPAGEFAGTGAQIARRAGLGKVQPGEVTPGFVPPTPGIQAAQTAADLFAPLPAGLASESKATQALTQASRSLPLVGASIDKRVGATIEKAGGAVQDIAENLSGGGIPDRTSAGAQVRPSLEGVIADNNSKIDQAYQSLRGVINPDAVSPVPATAVAIKRIMSERIAAGMKNPESELGDIINLTNKGASFDGLQRARADVGKIIGLAEAKPNPGFNVGDFKRLYGAMSSDMERTVRANATVHPDVAATALSDANKVAADLIDRNKNVQRLIGSGTAGAPGRPDENIIGSIINAAQGKSGNARLLAQLPKDSLEQVGSVALSEMGRNPQTGQFSLAKFGTEYRKLSDSGKSALFPDPAHRKALDGIANLDKVLKASDEYVNKSKTGLAVNLAKAATAVGPIGAAVATGNAPALFSILGSGAGAYGLAKYLARPATASALRKWATVAQDQATGRYGTGKAALVLASRNLMTNLRDVPGFSDAGSAPAGPLQVTVPVGDKLAAP